MFGERNQTEDAENRIKELDFGAESFNPKAFSYRSCTIFSMIAYNLMSIFRLFVLQEKRRKHYLHYDIEPLLLSYFEKVGDTLKLKIALSPKTQKMVRRNLGLPR